MAGFVWDDEALDDLDTLPDEEAVKVFESLEEADRNELISKMDERVARKAAPVSASHQTNPAQQMAAPNPPSFVGAPEWSKTPEAPDPIADRYVDGKGGRSVAPHVDGSTPEPFNMGLFGGVRDTAMRRPDSAADSYRKASDVVVKGAQQHIGLPIAKKIVDVSQEEGPVLKTLGRDFLRPMAGPDIYQYGGATTDTAVAADQTLDKLPGGSYIRPVVREGGNLLNYTPLGVETKLASAAGKVLQNAPTLAKIFGIGAARVGANALENTLIGGAMDSVNPEISAEQFGERRISDAVGGAVFKTGLSVGKGLLKAPKGVDAVLSSISEPPSKIVGSLTPDETKALAIELRTNPPDGEHFRAAAAGEKVTDPIFGTLRVAEDGKLYGQTLTAGKVLHEILIDGDAAGIAWRKSIQDKGGIIEAVLSAEDTARGGLELPTGAFTGFKQLVEPSLPVHLSEDEYFNFITSGVRRDAASSASTSAGRRKTLNLEDPTVVNQSGSTLIVEGQNGPKLEEVAVTHPNKRAGLYSVGDHVVDSDGAVGVLGEKNGVLVLKLPNGTTRPAESYNIRSATDAEVEASRIAGAQPERPVRDILIEAMHTGREVDVRDAMQLTGLSEIAAREVLGDLEAQGLVKQYGNTWDVTAAAPKARAQTMPPAAVIAQTQGVTPSQPALHGGTVMPGELAPQFAGDIKAATKLLGKMLQHDSRELPKFFKDFVDPQQRGPVEFHHHIREVRAAKQFDQARAGEEARIRRLLPGVKTEDAFDRDLDSAIRNPAAMDSIMEKHGQAWQAFRDEAHKLMAEKSVDDLEFKRLTGMDFDANPLVDGQVEAYVARRYWAFTKPKEWAKYLQKRSDILDQAVAGVKKEMPGSSDAAIAQELRNLLGTADPVAAYKNSKLSTKKSMLKRDDVPEHIRKFLGENKSGIMNIAETRATQKGIIASLKAWEQLSQDPRVFSLKAPPDPTWKRLENDPRKYGAAAGGFVPEEIFEAFGGLAENAPRSAEWALAFQRFLKGNQTAWNPRAHLRSVIGNLDSSVAAGGLNPFFAVEAAGLLREAHQAIKMHRADPMAPGLVFEAKKYGGDYSGFASKELKSAYDNSFKEFDRVFGKNPKNIIDFLKHLATPYTKSTEALGGLLDAGDQLFRVANYIGLRRKFMAKGMPMEEAARAASERINKYFWNAQNVGRHVERARTGAVGVVAPYLTPLAEDARTRVNMARGMVSEDLAFKARMVAWHGAFYGGALFGGKAAWNAIQGHDSETYENAQTRMTKQSETFKPLNGLLPFRDSQGRAQMFNYTPFSFPAQFTAGNQDDSVLARILANTVTAPLGEGTGKVARGVLESAGAVRSVGFTPPPMLEGENNLEKVLNLMADTSILPVGPSRFVKDIVKMKDKMGPFDTPPTTGQVAGRTMLDIQPVPATTVPRNAERKRELESAVKAMKAGAKDKKPDQMEAGKKRGEFLLKQEEDRQAK